MGREERREALYEVTGNQLELPRFHMLYELASINVSKMSRNRGICKQPVTPLQGIDIPMGQAVAGTTGPSS